MKIQVVPHNPSWRIEFEAEVERIGQALGKIVVHLHHIGSTAIPRVSAKPIIDLLLEVENAVELDGQNLKMEALGYEVMGEFGILGRRYFRKNDADGVRTYQVHAFDAGTVGVERHLAFRDYMIAHPGAARAYSALKIELSRRYPDEIEVYMNGKDAFIKEHEAKALTWQSTRPSH